MSRIKRYMIMIKNAIAFMKVGGAKNDPVSFCLPSGRFKGKHVLVTGGTTGIGYEIAKEFLAEGAIVLITARREDRLDKAKTYLNSNKLKTLVWDVSKVDTCEQKFNEAINILGDVDVFVNNAGIYKYESWDTCSEQVFDEVCDINAKGLFYLCQAEKEYLTDKEKKAKIINICSRNSIDSGFDPYTISKWEAASITMELAKEMIGKGVVVNGIAPGNVATNIHGDRVHDVIANAYMPSHLTERYVLTEEIASMTLFLASEKANHIVGQIIPVDGGWTLR